MSVCPRSPLRPTKESRAAVGTLRQLRVLRADELDTLSRFAGAELSKHRGDRVGEVRAAFDLKRVAD